MRIRTILRGTALCALILLPSAALAQSSGTAGAPAAAGVAQPRASFTLPPTTYGTSSPTSYVIGAYEFDPFNSATTSIAGMGGTGDRFPTTPGAFLLAAVHVPNGAVILAIEIQGCDASATGGLNATLYSNTTLGGSQSEVTHGSAVSGGAATPGCDYFSTNITPITVDNFNRTYYMQVTTGATDSTVRFSAVRVFYLLQVSPTPATASFTDVPVGHPFHRFVEALVEAGITGGCGGSNYCPDSPVTRGQMAVFLSVALGLHFPL